MGHCNLELDADKSDAMGLERPHEVETPPVFVISGVEFEGRVLDDAPEKVVRIPTYVESRCLVRPRFALLFGGGDWGCKFGACAGR